MASNLQQLIISYLQFPAIWSNLLLVTTLLLVLRVDPITNDTVNSTCADKPANWTEARFCSRALNICDSSACQSCEDCQITYPGNLPTTVSYSCGLNNQLKTEQQSCPVHKCSYCLACNTSNLAVLATEGVAVCKGCYHEDTVFWGYNTTFNGNVGACSVNVSCRSLPSSVVPQYQLSQANGQLQRYYGPVLMSTPVCPRDISGTPNLDTADPERGPVAGGTTVTITGNGLLNIARLAFGETKCDPLPFRPNNTDGQLLCRTSPASTPGEVRVKGQTAVWPVTWVDSKATFEFRPNPQVTAITEALAIAAGGIKVTFHGHNLGSSEDPVLLVTAVCRATLQIVQNFTAQCVSSEDETTLDCITPDVSGVNNLDSCPKPAADSSVNSSYSRFEFIMGLIFDGYMRYASLPSLPQFGMQGLLQVTNNVIIYRFAEDQSVKEFDPVRDSIIIIRGDGMNRGAKISDYRVSLGNGTSCVVASLLSNQLTCRPPAETPPADSNNFVVFKGQRTVSVVVSVGNLAVAVGYLYYAPPLLSTILLATLIPGAAIIAAVIAAIIYIKRRLKNGQSSIVCSKDKLQKRRSSNVYFSNEERRIPATSTELPQRICEELAAHLILRSDVSLKELLGQGQFGKIYRAVIRDEKVVAAKLMKDSEVTVDDVAKFLEEAVLMKDFRHANVLGLYGVVLDVGQPIVLVELMEVGDLRTALKRESFPMGDLVNFCGQIANGMAYLSAQKFIHRDLAARNCLLDRSYCVKIGDFGLSHDLDVKDYYVGKDRTKPLPVKWMAPESLANGLFTSASDVWSYGIVMWEIMAKGRIPYADVNNYEMKHYLLSGRRLDCPTDTPDAIYQIMRQCWNAVPARRPTFVRLLSLIDDLVTTESDHLDLERRFTKSIYQEMYSYATCLNEYAANPNLPNDGYLEFVPSS